MYGLNELNSNNSNTNNSPNTSVEEVIETPITIDDVVVENPVIEVVDPVEPDPEPVVVDPYQTLTSDYLTSETINEIASDTYNLNGVTNGTIAVTDLGELASELGLAETVETIAYTTSTQEDGSTVSYIETNTEAVGMYNGESNLEATSASDLNASVGDLEAVIISNTDGTSTVIKAGDEGFDAYKSNLEQQKKDIQWDKLTNLDYILDGADLVGEYTLTTTIGHTTEHLRDLSFYKNDLLGINVIVQTTEFGTKYFNLDVDQNGTIDSTYTHKLKSLNIKNNITNDVGDVLLYDNLLKMGEKESVTYNYLGDPTYLIKK